MIKYLLFFTLFSYLFLGCKQDDITPSWLKVDSFSLVTNEAIQGSDSHGITNAWIYMDGQALGAFELPCKIPVLDEGEHNFILLPGIKNNGISSTRTTYPFYAPFEITATLTKNDTTFFTPNTTYKNSVMFPYIEDFEGAGVSLNKGPSSDTDIVFVDKSEFPEIVTYGEKCGGIFLNSTDSLYTGSTMSIMNLPKAQPVYLEMDFRNDNVVAFGVIARFIDGTVNEHTPLIYLNAQDPGEEVWKKIYIDLTEDVSFEVSAVSYDVYFFSVLDPDNTEGNVYLDNIKVLHY